MTSTIVGQTLVYDGWYKLYRTTLRHRDGQEVERHIEDHGCAIAVLPYDPVSRAALVVRMPRAPVIAAGEGPFIEAIAGNLDGDAPEDCVRREAFEEAGIRLTDLEKITTIWTMPALSTERLHLFLAPYGRQDRQSNGGGCADEGEMITAEEWPLAELAAMARAGAMADAKLLILIHTLMMRRPELFHPIA